MQAWNLTKLNSFISIFKGFAKSVSYLGLRFSRLGITFFKRNTSYPVEHVIAMPWDVYKTTRRRIDSRNANVKTEIEESPGWGEKIFRIWNKTLFENIRLKKSEIFLTLFSSFCIFHSSEWEHDIPEALCFPPYSYKLL